MALILNVDTTGKKAMVCLSDGGAVVHSITDSQPMQHAAFLQPAIQQIMAETGLKLPNLDAVSVSNGPGSYTGLRVGLASAKGLCHALGKPLITLDTLQVMAKGAQLYIGQKKDQEFNFTDFNYIFWVCCN